MATCDLRLILSTHLENTIKMKGFEPSTCRSPFGSDIVPRKAALFAAARCLKWLVRAWLFRCICARDSFVTVIIVIIVIVVIAVIIFILLFIVTSGGF